MHFAISFPNLLKWNVFKGKDLGIFKQPIKFYDCPIFLIYNIFLWNKLNEINSDKLLTCVAIYWRFKKLQDGLSGAPKRLVKDVYDLKSRIKAMIESEETTLG